MPKFTCLFIALAVVTYTHAADPEEFVKGQKTKYLMGVEKADKELAAAKKAREKKVLKLTKDYINDLEKVKVYWTKKGDLEKALVYKKQIDELQKMINVGKPVKLKFEKKADAGSQLVKNDLTEKSWEVRCWNGQKWVKWPLRKMSLIEPSYGLKVKNTTGIHSFALLSLKEIFNGDFKISLRLKGGSSVGVGLASGVDSGIGVGCDQFGKDKEVSYVVAREKGTVSITANGKPQVLTYYQMTNGNTPVYLKIGMRSNESASITSLNVERGQ